MLPLQFAILGITGRERPYQSNYQNVFFDGGNSISSNHSALMWAFASVVAHEYPDIYAQLGAYGLATGVSLGRVGASQHFRMCSSGGLIGYQAWSTYHMGPKPIVQVGCRNVKIAKEDVPLGNTLQIANFAAILRPRALCSALRQQQ